MNAGNLSFVNSKPSHLTTSRNPKYTFDKPSKNHFKKTLDKSLKKSHKNEFNEFDNKEAKKADDVKEHNNKKSDTKVTDSSKDNPLKETNQKKDRKKDDQIDNSKKVDSAEEIIEELMILLSSINSEEPTKKDMEKFNELLSKVKNINQESLTILKNVTHDELEKLEQLLKLTASTSDMKSLSRSKVDKILAHLKQETTYGSDIQLKESVLGKELHKEQDKNLIINPEVSKKSKDQKTSTMNNSNLDKSTLASQEDSIKTPEEFKAVIDEISDKVLKNSREDNKSGRDSKENTSSEETVLKSVFSDTDTKESSVDSIFEDLINIKTKGSLSTKAQVQKSNVVKQLVNKQILDGVKSKLVVTDSGGKMAIELKPKDLGKLFLRISVDKGNVLAEIEVENQMVKQSIESNLFDLKNALGDKGYSIDSLDVSVNQDNEEGANDRAQEFFSKKNKKNKGDLVESVESITEKLLKNIELDSKRAVNYYV